PERVAEPIDRGCHIVVAQCRHDRPWRVGDVGAHPNVHSSPLKQVRCFVPARFSLRAFDAELVKTSFPFEPLPSKIKKIACGLPSPGARPPVADYAGHIVGACRPFRSPKLRPAWPRELRRAATDRPAPPQRLAIALLPFAAAASATARRRGRSRA